MTEETTLLNFPNEIKETAYERLGLNETDSDKFNFATISKTEGGIDYIEYWLLINAYYDETIERFIKMDGTATSFGIQMQAKGTYPGEQVGYTNNTGVNVWRNPRKADLYKDTTNFDYTDFDNNNHIGAKRRSDNAWIEFGIGAGWVNNLMTDSYGGVTVGGAGIEVDGNNIFPYARLTSSTYNDGTNDYYLLGILENAYHPSGSTWKCDSNEYEAWFFGFRYPKANGVKDSEHAKFIVMHNDMSSINQSAAGYTIEDMDVSDWEVILEINPTSIKAMVSGTLTTLGAGGGGSDITLIDEINDGDTTHAVTPNAVYDYLVSEYIGKSNTPGLMKNDGSVDTNSYLTSHQDITGKLDITQPDANKGKNVVVDSTTGDISFEDKNNHNHTNMDWADLTLNPNFYNFDNDNKVKYRKTSEIVNINGLPVLNANPAANEELIIGSLPEGYRPPRNVSFVAQCKDSVKLWTCTVKANGDITFKDLRDPTDFIAGTAFSDVLVLNVTFFINP